ncbi:lipid A deacylase LpxR family protein [Akkermansiaceae bacterium]|nr:lipid A deacylase LpxR family protein [Akkermansiaceae bacterium]
MVIAEERGTFELQWENDTFLNEPFGIRDYNDRHYTNGLLLK